MATQSVNSSFVSIQELFAENLLSDPYGFLYSIRIVCYALGPLGPLGSLASYFLIQPMIQLIYFKLDQVCVCVP